MGISCLLLLSYSLCIIFLFKSKNTRLENALAVQYSNQLTSASEKLTKLRESVDQTLLFTDKEALEQPLEDVWRISSDIRNSISALPIDHETSTIWMNYLNRIRKWCCTGQRRQGSDRRMAKKYGRC